MLNLDAALFLAPLKCSADLVDSVDRIKCDPVVLVVRPSRPKPRNRYSPLLVTFSCRMSMRNISLPVLRRAVVDRIASVAVGKHSGRAAMRAQA